MLIEFHFNSSVVGHVHTQAAEWSVVSVCRQKCWFSTSRLFLKYGKRWKTALSVLLFAAFLSWHCGHAYWPWPATWPRVNVRRETTVSVFRGFTIQCAFVKLQFDSILMDIATYMAHVTQQIFSWIQTLLELGLGLRLGLMEDVRFFFPACDRWNSALCIIFCKEHSPSTFWFNFL